MKIMFVVNKDIILYLFRREFVEHLIMLGHRIIVLSPQGEKTSYFESIGCTVETCSVDRRGQNLLRDIKTIKEYNRAIKYHEPDYIFTYTIKPNLYIGLISRFKKIRFMPTITGLGSATNKQGFLCNIVKMFYKFSFKNASVAFFQNKANLEWFNSNIKLKIPYELVPGSGVDIDRFHYYEYSSTNQTNYLFLGRIMKEKGIEEFLAASIRLKEKYKSAVNISMAGFFEEDYKNQIDELVRNETINYLGFLDDSLDALKNASVLPSYHEGLSNVILEAQAIGRAVIASNISGCIEAFVDGKSGLSVNVKDTDDLFTKMENFHLLSVKEKEEMGICGRIHVVNNFDRKMVIKTYTEFIK